MSYLECSIALIESIKLPKNYHLGTHAWFRTLKPHGFNTRLFNCIKSFDMQKYHHFLGCHATGINSCLIFFLSALCFLNLLWQAKNLTWIIVSVSSSSKLLPLSEIILSRSTARKCYWLEINVTLSRSSF